MLKNKYIIKNKVDLYLMGMISSFVLAFAGSVIV